VHQITDVYLMAALLSATAEKNRICLGFKYEFVIPRFEFGKSRKIKKYSWPSSIAVFDLQLPTLHNTPWSRLPFMESVNKQAKDGASTTIMSLASMCEALDILV
jgi:hypothetical protein